VPLIYALRARFGRRLADNDTYYADGTVGRPSLASQSAGLVWLAVVVVALPLIALLVVVGLFYEGILRIDRRPSLPSWLHWAISAGLGIVIVGGVTAVVLSRLL
jgi:hypothetical protein